MTLPLDLWSFRLNLLLASKNTIIKMSGVARRLNVRRKNVDAFTITMTSWKIKLKHILIYQVSHNGEHILTVNNVNRFNCELTQSISRTVVDLTNLLE